MSRRLDPIRTRFRLWMSATMLTTLLLLGSGLIAFSENQSLQFRIDLPASVRAELDRLEADDDDGLRTQEIYDTYWQGSPIFGGLTLAAVSLVLCVAASLAMSLWLSRLIIRPLASMADVASKVEIGDFSRHAVVGAAHGEMARMVVTFNGMVDALRNMESERRATAASISHELRTPLTVLQARLQALCDGVIEARPNEYRTLLGHVEHLGRLVSDLHTLSIADAGHLGLQCHRIDLLALVREALAQHQAQLAARRMALTLRLPARTLHLPARASDGESAVNEPGSGDDEARPGAPGAEQSVRQLAEVDSDEEDGRFDIRADPHRIRQILDNLIDNAVQHAADGHWLGVEVQRAPARPGSSDEDSVVMTVSDAGPGLPAALTEQPFRRFVQAPGRTKREGSGLGLSIVQALTVAQGGSLDVGRSERGGARFSVAFPAVPATGSDLA